ncbi:AAA family ATPase [bacterium]|nr:AAA family ATPase [bacterium]
MDNEDGGGRPMAANGVSDQRPVDKQHWAASLIPLAVNLAAGVKYERAAVTAFLYRACDEPLDGSPLMSKYARPKGVSADELDAAVKAAVNYALTPLIGQRADSIRPRKVEWLWQGYLPLSKLSVFSGDPGEGKSTLTLDLAARVTTGGRFVDGTQAPQGGVVLLTGEDDADDTIVPRLKAAEADLSRIQIITCAQPDGEAGPRLLTLPADIPEIADAVRKLQARLVVIDPLSSFLAGEVDANSDHDVRRVLAALADMATNTGAAVLLVRHLNKGSGQKAMYRAGGSIGVVAAARAAYLVGRVPDEPSGLRAIVPIKNNLAPLPKPRGFWLKPGEAGESARVEWSFEELNIGAEELLGDGGGARDTKLDDACRFLSEALKDGPRPSREIRDRAGERGISKMTLRRAREALGIEAFKRGRGDAGGWWLRLPGGEGDDADGEETAN